MRILSGIQPTGKIHVGNYFAMLRPMLEDQNTKQLFCFIADYHSLSSISNPIELKENIKDLCASLLALGLNPEKTVFWRQSDVPAVLELTWILSSHITIPQLQLAHSYKDKINQNIKPSLSLFSYPVLMAADILAFHAHQVPVGKDQKQHLEICRDIALRFNDCYQKNYFTLPEGKILKQVEVILGIDGRKMSKSYNNTLEIFAPEKKIRKMIMRIVTDCASIEEPKPTKNSILYDIYCLFLNDEHRELLKKKFQTPNIGYGHLKEELFKTMLEYFKEAREKKEELLQNPKKLEKILEEGASKARAIAQKNIIEIKKIIGLN